MKHLKEHFSTLYDNECNEINIRHSDSQMNVSLENGINNIYVYCTRSHRSN